MNYKATNPENTPVSRTIVRHTIHEIREKRGEPLGKDRRPHCLKKQKREIFNKKKIRKTITISSFLSVLNRNVELLKWLLLLLLCLKLLFGLFDTQIYDLINTADVSGFRKKIIPVLN